MLGSATVATFEGRTPLTEALVARGLGVVVDVSFARDDAEREIVLSWLRQARARALPRDVETYTHVAPLEPGTDAHLAARTAEHLAAVLRAPSGLVLARVHGLASARLAFGAPARDAPWIADARDIEVDPFRLLLRPALVVNVDHPVTVAARARARTSPELAAGLLARAILIERGVLDEDRDAALTERTLRAVLDRGGAR
jgi:hypothetical protein